MGMKIKRAFTIVEVLVVIGIIAILTVLIFPSISNIRAKNRDTEKIADISAIQLGLSLFKNQNASNTYPVSLDSLVPKYVLTDSLVGPGGEEYEYVPLTRTVGSDKCTSYHLGTTLEMSTGQIDTADQFDSTNSGGPLMNNYYWCEGYSGVGLSPGGKNYNVRP